ncbi:LysR family transcriptional regulator [Konateibacter massiliensis]|uniref:LysR family transcriptional regulator n=1 Tax=Konateibacter massiliensis TaxID=2002841 RepID=UPI000C15A101|nr:LysR family transcriptional regulator [Konateibacter massiliensis]
MNLFQFEYFITLAETLSYTKASQKLHISQSTLSKMIINLEHTIGSQLFIRNKRDVKLTTAGKIYYDEIKNILDTYEGTIRKIQNMENGTTGVINLGFLGTALVELLPFIINRFHEHYPTIRINPLDYTYSKIMESLFNNEIDIAILPDLELEHFPNLAKKPIFKDSMCAVVHKDHRFSKLDKINIADLKDEPIVSMDPKVSRHDSSLISNICIKQGFFPNVIYEANSLLNMLVMVDCQVGITIMASHMKHFATDTVRFVPIAGLENSFHVVCVHNSTTNESVPKLLAVIDECFPPEN